MTEAGNIFKWSRATQEVRQLTPDPIGVGSKYLIVSRFLGFDIPLEVEVTEYQENKVVASRAVSTGFIVDGRTLYSSEGAGTLVKSESEIHPRRFWKLLQPWLPSMISKSSAKDYERLKRALEAAPSLDEPDTPKVVTVSDPVVTLES